VPRAVWEAATYGRDPLKSTFAQTENYGPPATRSVDTVEPRVRPQRDSAVRGGSPPVAPADSVTLFRGLPDISRSIAAAAL